MNESEKEKVYVVMGAGSDSPSATMLAQVERFKLENPTHDFIIITNDEMKNIHLTIKATFIPEQVEFKIHSIQDVAVVRDFPMEDHRLQKQQNRFRADRHSFNSKHYRRR